MKEISESRSVGVGPEAGVEALWVTRQGDDDTRGRQWHILAPAQDRQDEARDEYAPRHGFDYILNALVPCDSANRREAQGRVEGAEVT
jgi:hypothetical protein